MYNRVKLDNGLKIVAKRMPSIRSLSLGIWVNIGGRYETEDEKGISHFLEHLLFKGSRRYSCRKIKESIEGVGGALNGFTSEELTCYLVKIPSRYLRLSLDILSDMLLEPALKANDIKKEKAVILEELKMYRDLPQSYVYELLDGLLWPAQPLGLPIIGEAESIKRISRNSLSRFQQRHYSAPNLVVSAVGFLDYDLLAKSVARIFSSQAAGKLNSFAGAIEAQARQQLKIFYKDTEQTHMALGFHAFSRKHRLKHAQAILHIVLGANMSSRLFNELREKRALAYEIGTVIKRYQDTGAFVVHAGVDNDKVVPSLGLIFKELSRVKRELISNAEFKRAKEFYLGQLMLALEDTTEHMLWIGEMESCLDKVYSLEEIVRQVKKVTLEELRLAARQIFRQEGINLALIGPLKNKEKQLYAQLCV